MEKIIDLQVKEHSEGGTTLLNWEAEEGEKREKKMQIGIAIFLIIFLTFVILQKNYFGIILTVVIAFLLFFPAKRKRTYFAILKRGARRENEVFLWSNLESFWILEEPYEISFKSKKSYLPYHIIFPLPKEYVKKIRKILLNFIPEKETERNVFDILSRRFGI